MFITVVQISKDSEDDFIAKDAPNEIRIVLTVSFSFNPK